MYTNGCTYIYVGMCVCARARMYVCSVYTHMYMCMYLWASQVAVVVKNLPANPRAAERRI